METATTPSKKIRKRATPAIRHPQEPPPDSPKPSGIPKPPTSLEPDSTEKKTKTSKLRAKWSEDDDRTMIEILTAERQPANTPIGPDNATCAQGWKLTTWNTVANRLAGSEERKVNGVVSLSGVKTVDVCKAHWYVLCNLYADYKYLNGLSGAGWENGCIVLPDNVWAPIINNKESKKSKDYLQCKDQPFPLYDAIAPLVDGHKATAKYVKSAVIEEVTAQDVSSPNSTQDINNHHSSPCSDFSDLPGVDSKAKDESSSDEAPAAKRHRTSKVALQERAPVKRKKRSGIDVIEDLTADMNKIGSKIESSIASTSNSVEAAAQSFQREAPSVHAQAVTMVYASKLDRPQQYAAVELFAEKPLMAETYLNTPVEEADDWLLTLLAK